MNDGANLLIPHLSEGGPASLFTENILLDKKGTLISPTAACAGEANNKIATNILAKLDRTIPAGPIGPVKFKSIFSYSPLKPPLFIISLRFNI